MSIGVLLVDDERLVRAGFRMILKAEHDLEVVGEAADGLEAVEKATRLRPDVVLMDIRMPTLDGLEATRRILAGPDPRPRVIVLTTFDLDKYVYEALRVGASGFLLKDAPEDQLVAAIRIAADGGSIFAPSVTRRLIEEFARRSSREEGLPELAELTPRELQVFRLVASGLSNSEIAAKLVVSEHTAKTHVAHILQKLNLRDRVQAVVLAYETELVVPGASGRREPAKFLTGRRRPPVPDRVLATVMFTDMVGSTQRATELGDRRWRELLLAHQAAVRKQLERFGGREIDTAGDGFFAAFDGPAQAIRCACAIRDAVQALGVEIRTGLHTGECELMEEKVGGIAVHTGARVAALAGPGEVLVSSTVKDLVAGSRIEFEDRGFHELKGVPGKWRIYAVTAP